MRDLAPTSTALSNDPSVALRYLYSAGYLHRDISDENILLVVDNAGCAMGKLSDLEYAIAFKSHVDADTDSHAPKPVS